MSKLKDLLHECYDDIDSIEDFDDIGLRNSQESIDNYKSVVLTTSTHTQTDVTSNIRELNVESTKDFDEWFAQHVKTGKKIYDLQKDLSDVSDVTIGQLTAEVERHKKSISAELQLHSKRIDYLVILASKNSAENGHLSSVLSKPSEATYLLDNPYTVPDALSSTPIKRKPECDSDQDSDMFQRCSKKLNSDNVNTEQHGNNHTGYKHLEVNQNETTQNVHQTTISKPSFSKTPAQKNHPSTCFDIQDACSEKKTPNTEKKLHRSVNPPPTIDDKDSEPDYIGTKHFVSELTSFHPDDHTTSKTVGKKNAYRCRHCVNPSLQTNLHSFRVHVLSQHTAKQGIMCTTCGFFYNTESAVKKHIKKSNCTKINSHQKKSILDNYEEPQSDDPSQVLNYKQPTAEAANYVPGYCNTFAEHLRKPTENTNSEEVDQASTRKDENEIISFVHLEEMDDTISLTLANMMGDNGKVILQTKYTLHEDDEIVRLRQNKCMNDTIIDAYFSLLQSLSQMLPSRKSVYAFPARLYTQYCGPGYSRVIKYAPQDLQDILHHEILLFPVNVANIHWTLVVADTIEQRFYFYDAYRNGYFNRLCKDENRSHPIHTIKNYLMDKKEKTGLNVNFTKWKECEPMTIPLQSNNIDCGVFTCEFAKRTCLEEGMGFTQEDMPTIRKEILLSLLKHMLVSAK